MVQPDASVRPVIVNRSCTPPSGVFVPGTLMNRASRTGPFAVTKEGTVFVAPSRVATATCGFPVVECPAWSVVVKFPGGLLPPTMGYTWQLAHEFALNRGPRPAPSSPGMVPETESTSWKRCVACWKKFDVGESKVATPSLESEGAVFGWVLNAISAAVSARGPGSTWADACPDE